MSLYAATATSVFYTLSLHDALPILLAVTSVRCRLDFHVADQIRPQGRCSPCLRVRRLDQRQQGVRPPFGAVAIKGALLHVVANPYVPQGVLVRLRARSVAVGPPKLELGK